MLKNFIKFGLIVNMIVFLGVSGECSSKAWKIWRQGYEDFEMAERADLDKQYKTSLMMYRKALTGFLQIQKTQPTWNKRIVDEKIKLCRRKIGRIKEKLMELQRAKSKSISSIYPEKSTSSPTGSEQLEKMRKELASYKERLFKALLELEDNKNAAARDASAADAVKALMKEKSALEREVTSLKQRNASLKSKVKAPDEDIYEIRKQMLTEKIKNEELKKDIALLKAGIAKEKAKRDKALQSGNVNKYNLKLLNDKISKYSDKIKRLSEKLTVAEKSNAELDKTLKTMTIEKKQLTKSLDDKKKELEKLRKDFRKAGSKSGSIDVGSQILKENESYRKKVASAEAQLKSLLVKHDILVRKYSKLYKEKGSLNSTLVGVNKAKNVYEKDFNNLSKKYRKLLKESNNKQIKIDDLNKKVMVLNKELKELADSYDALKNKKKKTATSKAQNFIATQKIKTLNTKLLKANNEVRKLQDQYASLVSKYEKLSDVKTEYNSLLKRYENIAVVRDKYIQLNSELAKYKLLKIDHEKAVKKLEQLNALKRKNTSLLIQVKELKSKTPVVVSPNKVQINSEVIKLKKQVKSLSLQLSKAQVALKSSGLRNGKTAKAVKAPKLSREERVKTVVYLLQVAFNSEQQNDIESAVWHYKKVLKIAPENFTANRKIGNLLLVLNKDDEAEKYLKKAYSINKNSPEVLYGLAELNIKKKSYDKALGFLEKANIMDPDGRRGFFLKGIMLKSQKKNSLAIKTLKKAVDKDAEYKEALTALAKLFSEKTGGRKAARGYYQRALEAGAKPEPDFEKQIKLKKNKKNVKTGESAAFLMKSASEATKKKDYTSALWFYKQLLKVKPEMKKAWQVRMVDIYLKQKQDKKAFSVLNDIAMQYGKDANGAKTLISSVLKQNSDSGPLHMYFCKFLIKNFPGLKDEVRKNYEIALKKGVKPDKEVESFLGRK